MYKRRKWIESNRRNSASLGQVFLVLVGAGSWPEHRVYVGIAAGVLIIQLAVLRMIARWQREEDAETLARAREKMGAIPWDGKSFRESTEWVRR